MQEKRYALAQVNFRQEGAWMQISRDCHVIIYGETMERMVHSYML